jgi:hypothetical protein
MGNREVIFFFPSTVFSGHEKMALKILEKSPFKISCILNQELVSRFTLNNQVFSYFDFFTLIKILLKIRFHKRKITIVIIAGSPFGFLVEKILIKLLFFKLIDYVPVPELKVIQDRFHHRFMPILNKVVIDKRVLIDDWQIKYSAVKNCVIIKNIIEND